MKRSTRAATPPTRWNRPGTAPGLWAVAAGVPLLVPVLALVLAGCSAPARVGDASADGSLRVVALDELAIEPASYARVFQAARDEIRTRGWEWERVDLEQGIISSAVATVGARGIDDLANRHARQVRVTFLPASPETDPDRGGTMSAARASELGRPMLMRIGVTVFREQVPGWQPQTNSARLAGRWTDPELQKRELQPAFSVAERQDQATASELLAAVMGRATLAAPAATSPDAPDAPDATK